MATQYLAPGDLRGATTTYQGQGVDFSQFPLSAVNDVITQASRKITAFCRDRMDERVVQEFYSGNGTNRLRLRHWPLWSGLRTTLAGAVVQGATSITLASATGLLPGQYINWDDGLEASIPIASTYTPGSTTVPLASATAAAHASAAPLHVNAVDYIQVMLPGNSTFSLDISQLVLEPELGTLVLYSTLFIPLFGYASIFPKDVPLQVQYTAGYTYPYPDPITQVCLELCISTVLRNASPGLGGLQSTKSEEQEDRFFNMTLMPELNADQKDWLMPYRRGRGIR